MHEKLWTIRDVCEYLGIHRSHLHALICKGRVPQPMRVSPRNPRWPESIILEWIKQQQARKGGV